MRTIFVGTGKDPKVVLTGLKEPKEPLWASGDVPAFEGYVMYRGYDTQWYAYALTGGYMVHFVGGHIKRPQFRGATFNLGLEVAQGIRDAL